MHRNGFVWSKWDQRARCPRRKHRLADDFFAAGRGQYAPEWLRLVKMGSIAQRPRRMRRPMIPRASTRPRMVVQSTQNDIAR
jgi:hypothetical protein